jgi:hypothetical protein
MHRGRGGKRNSRFVAGKGAGGEGKSRGEGRGTASMFQEDCRPCPLLSVKLNKINNNNVTGFCDPVWASCKIKMLLVEKPCIHLNKKFQRPTKFGQEVKNCKC